MRISDWSSDVCSSDLIQNGAVNPACKLKPEIHKEQGELHHADRHHGLELVGTDDEYQRDTDHESHLKERQRHGQRLAHDIHRGKKTDRTNRDAKRSEEHKSELQSLMRISYAVFCLKKKNTQNNTNKNKTKVDNIH